MSKENQFQKIIRGVRVDGENVIIAVNGGNDAARYLCGKILLEKEKYAISESPHPKHGLCDECETVSHCLKHGCIPKQPAPAQDTVADEIRCPECGYLTKHTEHIGCLRKKLNAINAFEQRNFAIVNMDKFPKPKPAQEPNYKELYEQACERLDEMDKALAEYEQKEPKKCFLCGISDPAVTDICRHEICGMRE